MFYHLFLKTNANLDFISKVINDIFEKNSVRNENVIKITNRESINKGGEYVLVELETLCIDIIYNQGEVIEEDFLDYKIYLYVYPKEQNDSSKQLMTDVINYINFMLKEMNYVTELKKYGK